MEGDGGALTSSAAPFGPARRVPLLLLAPSLVVLGGLFGGGLLLAVARTFGLTPFGATGTFTVSAYDAALSQPDLLASTLVTLWIASASTVLSVALGTAAAFALDDLIAKGRGRLSVFLFQVNLTVPHVIAAVGILWLFGQSGFLARLAAQAGVIGGPADFPVLVFDRLGIGIILSTVWKEVPFVGMVALGALHAVGDGPARTARMLGATPLQAIRHVTLPLILPAVTAAATIVFAFAIGTYETAAILGASHPKPLAVLAVEMFTSRAISDRPAAIVLSLAIALLGFVLIAGWRRLLSEPDR